MTGPRPPTLAVNTLSVSDANEGTRTMLRQLLLALAERAPELRLLLVCSPVNRHLFEGLGDAEVVEVPLRGRQVVRRIWADQVHVPRIVRGRADVLLNPTTVGALRCSIPQVVIVPAHLVLPSCRVLAGPDAVSLPHRIYHGPVLRASLRRAARVLAISEFLAEGLVEELGVDPERVGAMPLGVDPPTWDPRATDREPLVLFVGTLYPYKDAAVAVRAFATALDRLPTGTRVVVVGRDPTGAEAPALAALAATLGVADRIGLPGSITDDQLEDLYRRAAALVLPSRCEGFGLPLAEAMSRGVPVVAAAATALPEVVRDSGLLVEPGDVAGFADALVRATAPGPDRDELVERGYQRAAELSWAATAEHLWRAVEALLP